MPLPMDVAVQLHREMGEEVRSGGYAGGRDPKEEWNHDYSQPDSYHIDTQEGLNRLAELITKHAHPWPVSAWKAEIVMLESRLKDSNRDFYKKHLDEAIQEIKQKILDRG